MFLGVFIIFKVLLWSRNFISYFMAPSHLHTSIEAISFLYELGSSMPSIGHIATFPNIPFSRLVGLLDRCTYEEDDLIH